MTIDDLDDDRNQEPHEDSLEASVSWSRKQVDKEIAALLQIQEENNGKVVSRSWIIQALLQRHATEVADHTSFAWFGLREFCGSQVRDFFNRLRRLPIDTLTLPGFEHLQEGYALERGGDLVYVPITLCSDEELIGKADLYEADAETLRQHAIELRRYVAQRKKNKKA